MNRINAETTFDLKPHFPNGGRFTSGEIRDLIAQCEGINPAEIDMSRVFAAIAVLCQLQGEVQLNGGKYVFTPLAPSPVTMAGFNW